MQNFLGWDPGVFIIETKHVENAVATQAAILVNPDWIENLSDQEIMAVVAHELAHVKHRHLAERLAIYADGFVNAIFDFKNEMGFSERFSGFRSYFSTTQEISADCTAYNWLSEMRAKGYAVDEKALASVFKKSTPFIEDFESYGLVNEPVYVRYKKIMKGHPHECH